MVVQSLNLVKKQKKKNSFLVFYVLQCDNINDAWTVV